jgi:hypothetical protein
VLNRGNPFRLRAILQPRNAARLLAALAIGIALALVFLPPLRTKFVSDTFGLYSLARVQSPADLIGLFVPQAAHWYRPLNDIFFWLEAHAFGQEAIGYHLVALMAHVISAALILLLTERLSGSRKAAVCAALVFLVNVHAHEPLWDVADLHTALSTLIFLAVLLSYVAGRRKVSWLLALIALGVDETGLLAIATIGLYEVIVAVTAVNWTSLRVSILRLAPFAILGIAYLAMRLFNGSIYVENIPCRTPRCLLAASEEYFSRSFVRPEMLVSWWDHRWIYVALGLAIIAVIVFLTKPWTWPERRTSAFVIAWWALATSYFVLSLWPYIADRFVYVPDCALAVLIGLVAARTFDTRVNLSQARRWGNVAIAAVLVAWVAAGLWMLYGRGQLWIKAGDEAASITHTIHALVPNPPPNSVFIVLDVPHETQPAIPPGNTGPYVFHNGLESAIRLEYNRSDLTVVPVEGSSLPTPAPAAAFVFDVRDGSVVQIP